MAREGNIENPTKVTLYMPKETVKRGKNYAAKTGSSLSQLVTNLVEQEIGDEVPVTVKFSVAWWEKLRAGADKLGMTLEQYIQTRMECDQDCVDV